MENFKERGLRLRKEAKILILDYMNTSQICQPNSEGIKLASLFRDCGFDWGPYENTTSSNQQYWIVALARELEKEGKIERIVSKKWRLKDKGAVD